MHLMFKKKQLQGMRVPEQNSEFKAYFHLGKVGQGPKGASKTLDL